MSRRYEEDFYATVDDFSSTQDVVGHSSKPNSGIPKYAQLLAVIEDMGREVRTTYTGNKLSAEKLKRGIMHARILVRECLIENERSARQ